MSKSFIEELINRQFNLSEEVLAINELLNEESSYANSLYYVIDTKFRKWKHRKNFTSLDSMFEKYKIETIVGDAKLNLINLDTYVFYAECIINILNIVKVSELNSFNKGSWTVIYENIVNTTTQLNYHIHYFENEDYFKIIIKDWKVSSASEIIQDKYDLGQKIYLYNHYSLKGYLNEKADILCRLYKSFESEQKVILNNNGYTSIVSDIGFLSEKLDIRHAPNKKEKILLDGLTKEEQESWYDELFNLYLGSIILCEHIKTKKDVKLLNQKLANIKN